MHFRRVFGFLLLFVMFLSAAGCGGYGGKKGDNEGKDQPKSAEKTTTG